MPFINVHRFLLSSLFLLLHNISPVTSNGTPDVSPRGPGVSPGFVFLSVSTITVVLRLRSLKLKQMETLSCELGEKH